MTGHRQPGVQAQRPHNLLAPVEHGFELVHVRVERGGRMKGHIADCVEQGDAEILFDGVLDEVMHSETLSRDVTWPKVPADALRAFDDLADEGVRQVALSVERKCGALQSPLLGSPDRFMQFGFIAHFLAVQRLLHGLALYYSMTRPLQPGFMWLA